MLHQAREETEVLRQRLRTANSAREQAQVVGQEQSQESEEKEMRKHRGIFEEKDGGTLCLDHVEYAVWGGALINWLFVRRDVEKIFAFRQEALRRLFGAGG